MTAPVAIVMGSQSDWPTMKCAADALDKLGVAYEARIVSAHRTPDRLASFAPDAGAFTNIVSFGVDRAGNLYIVDIDGEIFVIERAP